MKYNLIQAGGREFAEIDSDEIIIRNVQDALDLMANVRNNSLILRESNFEKSFFDLGTGLLGEILQKFTNYQVRLAIIGDFGKSSRNFQAFIGESNRHGRYLFVDSLEEVKRVWGS
ncbi:MAG: DUF4180 domain-containing protein [Candidatus Saccharibacteria bacterium]